LIKKESAALKTYLRKAVPDKTIEIKKATAPHSFSDEGKWRSFSFYVDMR